MKARATAPSTRSTAHTSWSVANGPPRSRPAAGRARCAHTRATAATRSIGCGSGAARLFRRRHRVLHQRGPAVHLALDQIGERLRRAAFLVGNVAAEIQEPLAHGIV